MPGMTARHNATHQKVEANGFLELVPGDLPDRPDRPLDRRIVDKDVGDPEPVGGFTQNLRRSLISKIARERRHSNWSALRRRIGGSFGERIPIARDQKQVGPRCS
jgi:hypothetical protein